MKITILTSIMTLIFVSRIQNKDLYQKRQGICSTYPKTCPKSKQLKGICCRNSKGIPQYYNNFCLACSAGCDTFVYKTVDNGKCEEDDL